MQKKTFNKMTAGPKIFKKDCLLPAYRRNKNIKELLVRAKIGTDPIA